VFVQQGFQRGQQVRRGGNQAGVGVRRLYHRMLAA
jgi:hypothetical protein